MTNFKSSCVFLFLKMVSSEYLIVARNQFCKQEEKEEDHFKEIIVLLFFKFERSFFMSMSILLFQVEYSIDSSSMPISWAEVKLQSQTKCYKFTVSYVKRATQRWGRVYCSVMLIFNYFHIYTHDHVYSGLIKVEKQCNNQQCSYLGTSSGCTIFS